MDRTGDTVDSVTGGLSPLAPSEGIRDPLPPEATSTTFPQDGSQEGVTSCQSSVNVHSVGESTLEPQGPVGSVSGPNLSPSVSGKRTRGLIKNQESVRNPDTSVRKADNNSVPVGVGDHSQSQGLPARPVGSVRSGSLRPNPTRRGKTGEELSKVRRLSQTPEAIQRSREEHLKHKEVGEQLAWAFFRHGAMTKAVREVFPDLGEKQVMSKAMNLARAHWFKKILDRISQAVELSTEVSAHWVLLKLKNEAMYAKASADRIHAAELLGKHLGMFVERRETRTMKLDLSAMPREEILKLIESRKRSLPE